MPDFKYELTLPSKTKIKIREICPKDFYQIQIWRNSEDMEDSDFIFNLLAMVMIFPTNKKTTLGNLSIKDWNSLTLWVTKNIVTEKIFTVEDWLTQAFYLLRERWNDSLDWLEKQPITKILFMLEVLKGHAERIRSKIK